MYQAPPQEYSRTQICIPKAEAKPSQKNTRQSLKVEFRRQGDLSGNRRREGVQESATGNPNSESSRALHGSSEGQSGSESVEKYGAVEQSGGVAEAMNE